jgi:ADP-ribose pyrophosphatase YjhB (NUDIX family)
MKKIMGVVAIIENKGKYLLILNKGTGNITFVSGKCNENETPEHALKREINEEVGLEEGEYRLMDTKISYKFTYNQKKVERANTESENRVYLIKTLKENLECKDNSVEILGWFEKEEVLSKLTFNDLKEIFRKINKTEVK